MSITIKYQAIKDSPMLLTPQGRFPASPESLTGDGATPLGLWRDSQTSGLSAQIKAQEQERVLRQVRARVQLLDKLLERVHVPGRDVLANVKTAVSDQPEALEAQADDNATTPHKESVQAYLPAKGGEITSPYINPIAYTDLLPGDYDFTLTIDGQEHELSVHVNSGPDFDTQEDVMGRVARAIDLVDSRLSAEVTAGFEDAYDPSPRSRPMDRVVQLRVWSDDPSLSFSLSESDPGVVEAFGLDAGLPPRQALVSTGGALRSQADNTLSLDGGHLTAEVLASTKGLAEIDVSRGPEVITEELARIVTVYNELVSYLDAHADVLRPSLKDRITRPLEERAALMPAVGLRATPQGRFKVLEGFAQQVAGDFGQVREVFFAADGWAPAMRGKLGQILAMDEEAFAAELEVNQPLSPRERAWALVDSLSNGIVQGYY